MHSSPDPRGKWFTGNVKFQKNVIKLLKPESLFYIFTLYVRIYNSFLIPLPSHTQTHQMNPYFAAWLSLAKPDVL
jgi:hypothetical protein